MFFFDSMKVLKSDHHPTPVGFPTAKLTGKLFRPRDLLRRKWQTLTKADFQKFASWTTQNSGKNPWILMILIGLLEAFLIGRIHGVQHRYIYITCSLRLGRNVTGFHGDHEDYHDTP